MTYELKMAELCRDAIAEGRAEGRAAGEGRMISLLLSDGRTPEEVAQMFRMSVEEVQRLEKNYLNSLTEN